MPMLCRLALTLTVLVVANLGSRAGAQALGKPEQAGPRGGWSEPGGLPKSLVNPLARLALPAIHPCPGRFW